YAKFDDNIDDIKDLKKGMVLEGVVTNVTNFGAFTDIGVHQDGLIHISQLSDTFVKNPADIVAVGDQVKVEVIGLDLDLKRIQLKKV
ncbi:S1 RNA-binding domain-containing protein, partial [bacterium]|nr:S1 RNA-binding domain-containing protein [bacterium]